MRPRRAVHADGLLDVPDRAFDSLLVGPGEAERVRVRRVVSPHGRIDPHVLDVHDVREVAVDPAGVVRVPRERVVHDAVADVHDPRVVHVHVALEAARRDRRRVGGLVHVDPPRPELAVLEGVAPDGLRVVLELEDVLVGVDPVAEEIDPVQQEERRVRRGERPARRRGLHVRVLGGVAAPRALRLCGDDLPQLVGGVWHPHEHEVLYRRVRSVRDHGRRRLRRAADEVARVVRERCRRRGQRVQRLCGRGAVARRRFRRIDVHHVEVYVRVSHFPFPFTVR